MRNTIITRCIVSVVLVCLTGVTWGANIDSVNPAYPIVVKGSTFTVKVVVTGAWSGSHYVQVSMKGSDGFTVLTGTQSITHLKSGVSKTLEFSVRASSDRSGQLTIVSKWSSNYSGSGTILTSQRVQPISCNSGWKVNVQLLHPKYPPAGGTDAVWTVTNSWRYSANKQSSSPPYYTTFAVPATPSYYTISIAYKVLEAIGGKNVNTKWWSQTVTVYISKSGQVITL